MNNEFQFGKIGLIKLLRIMTNIGLKEAKLAVDTSLALARQVIETDYFNDETVVAGAILIATNNLRRAIELAPQPFFQAIALYLIDNPPE